MYVYPLGFDLLEEPGGDVVVGLDVQVAGGQCGRGSWVLHVEAGLQRRHLRLVRAVRHRLTLRRQLTRGHPPAVLVLLQRERTPDLLYMTTYTRPSTGSTGPPIERENQAYYT
jgi:hypothetical protein